jgi:hypothetical protein
MTPTSRSSCGGPSTAGQPGLASGPLAGAAFAPFDSVASRGVRLPNDPPERGERVVVNQVTPGYFDLLGIRLIEGWRPSPRPHVAMSS